MWDCLLVHEVIWCRCGVMCDVLHVAARIGVCDGRSIVRFLKRWICRQNVKTNIRTSYAIKASCPYWRLDYTLRLASKGTDLLHVIACSRVDRSQEIRAFWRSIEIKGHVSNMQQSRLPLTMETASSHPATKLYRIDWWHRWVHAASLHALLVSLAAFWICQWQLAVTITPLISFITSCGYGV